jgi:predicted AlkP superfamily pyrophosphatase or phosphodiesterase
MRVFMRILNASLIIVAAVLQLSAQTKVVIVGVDGLSTDGVRTAKTPRLHQLMERGSWTLKARGVMPTVSSPNWASMIMGAGPEQHGVTSNEWQPDKFEIASVCKQPDHVFPTIFGVLRAARPKAEIAVLHDWEGFGRLVEAKAPQRLEHVLKSTVTMKKAIEHWQAKKPDLLFVHLDDVDHAGHRYGWLTPEYYAAVEEADGLIGNMMDAIGRDAVLIIISDHGGVNKGHGGLTMTELEVPWMIAGPGVKKGELTVPVNSLDTAPTVAKVMGIAPHACWTGRAVSAALGKK